MDIQGPATTIGALLATVIVIVTSGLGSMSMTMSDTIEPGCDELLAYRNDVYGVFADYPAFTDWWIDSESPDVAALPADDAEVIVAEGRAFVGDLGDLVVPPVYADGHDGWIGIYDFFNDLIAWVVLGEDTEPDPDDLQLAVDRIDAAEEQTAVTCASEIADLDGFVLISAESIENVNVPDDPLDIGKDFL